MKYKIGKRLIKIGFLTNQIYKEAILVNVLTNFLFIIMQYYMWKAVYETNSMDMYSFKEMFSYIILAQLIGNIYPVNVSRRIGQLVRTGDISLTLLNPFSFIEQLFFENVGTSLFKLLITNIPLYAMYLIFIGVNVSVLNVLKFILILMFSYFFYFVFELLFGILSFYTKSSWGLNSFKYVIIVLFSGRLMPLNFYPRSILKILNLLPFKYMYNVPISILLGKFSNFWGMLFLLGINLIIIFLIYKISFAKTIKRLTIQGG